MKMLHRTLITTTMTVSLSLTAMITIAAPEQSTQPTQKNYPEVVVKETVVTKPAQSKAQRHRDMTTTPAFARLNLSNAQKQQIQKINAQYPLKTGVLTSDDKALQSLRQQRQELMAQKQFDETKARNILSQEGKIMAQKQEQRADAELQKLKRDHAIYQVLTPKQRDQLMKQRVRHMGL